MSGCVAGGCVERPPCDEDMFCEEAHRRGLKVAQNGIYGHSEHVLKGGDMTGRHRAPGKVRWRLSLRRQARRAVAR